MSGRRMNGDKIDCNCIYCNPSSRLFPPAASSRVLHARSTQPPPRPSRSLARDRHRRRELQCSNSSGRPRSKATGSSRPKPPPPPSETRSTRSSLLRPRESNRRLVFSPARERRAVRSAPSLLLRLRRPSSVRGLAGPATSLPALLPLLPAEFPRQVRNPSPLSLLSR